MAQQTAVEWLFEKMSQTSVTNWYEVREQALAMEKEQIINAMIEEHMFDDSDYANRRYKYWQKVKQNL